MRAYRGCHPFRVLAMMPPTARRVRGLEVVGVSGRKARLLAVAAWVVAIFGVSSVPHLTAPHLGSIGSDKIFHALEYGVLGTLFGWATGARGARLVWSATLLGLCVGALDELYQGSVPGRQQDIFDAGTDVLGALLGGVAWEGWMRRRKRMRS